MKEFNLFINQSEFQNKFNKFYPEKRVIKELADLRAAAEYDHVGATYQDNRRSVNNFLSANCLIMDIDNNDTDNKDEWINEAKLRAIFTDVEYYIIFSKSHETIKVTGGKEYSARPRYHVYFPLRQEINDAAKLKNLKEHLIEICPAFDPGAKDAARFIFGVKEAKGLPQRGTLCIDDFIANYLPDTIDAEFIDAEFEDIDNHLNLPENIKTGERNTTLFGIALKALLKYNFEDAKVFFENACSRCKPQLSAKEINTIWKSAQKMDVVKNANKRRANNKKLKNLHSNDVADIIEGFSIKARLNRITGKAEVIGLPLNSLYISNDFKTLTPNEQKEHGTHELRLFLTALLKDEGYSFTDNYLKDILALYFSYHAFNPVLEMLKPIVWDGQDRISKLGQILNISDNAHYMTMLKKWLIQAVSILHNDGNNSLDFVLTLQGRQGIGKTEFFRVIGMRPDWVRLGMVIDMNNKDSRIEATSCWICEIGELDSTLKKEQTSLKAFITQTNDRYRRPYAAEYEDKPRQACFCATVNDERFLRDPTGNRRWAVIPVNKIDLTTLHSLKDEWLKQLWRQAYELYLSGEFFRLTNEERETNEKLNKNSVIYLRGEQEILEGLNWGTGTLPEFWGEYTASDLKATIPALKYIDVRTIGRALKKLAENDKRITVRTLDGTKRYRLPEKLKNTNEEISNFYNIS